jgi:hypothetical protein
VNYDMPNSIEDYVHRIGRTGRAGQTGEAYAFFTPKNARMANDLAKYLVEACQVGHRLTSSTAFPARVVNRISHFFVCRLFPASSSSCVAAAAATDLGALAVAVAVVVVGGGNLVEHVGARSRSSRGALPACACLWVFLIFQFCLWFFRNKLYSIIFVA